MRKALYAFSDSPDCRSQTPEGSFGCVSLKMSSLVENVPGFTSLEMSPLQLRQAACRYSGLARIGVAPDAYPRPRRRTGSGAIGTSKTLLVLRRVLLFPHWLGEAPERRSWVGKRETAGPVLPALLIAFRLSARLGELCVRASAGSSSVSKDDPTGALCFCDAALMACC